MQIGDFIAPNHVFARLKAASARQALQHVSHLAAKSVALPEAVIFETLLERERLGSTGIGGGIAVPHGKFAALTELTGFFASIEHPIDFDAVDATPVDLLFLLLAPENAGGDHLQALACISRRLQEKNLCKKLRACKSAPALFTALTRQKPPAPAKKQS